MHPANDPLVDLPKEELRDLLAKGWLTHDGMWFVHAAADQGPEGANRLNRAAIRGMSPIEVGRLAEVLGFNASAPPSAGDLQGFLTGALTILLPSSISRRIHIAAPEAHALNIEWDDGECFAYKGMKRAGLLDQYECGVLYRIECWLDAMGIAFSIDPPTGRCRMAADHQCSAEITLHSPGKDSLPLAP